MFGDKYCGWRHMENRRQTPTQPSMASRFLSTFESAGLAATATFASVLWVGLALPGLPLLPGVGGGQNSNVAISLNSAVLGVQDSRTFAPSSGVAGRQARLLSLLLPAPDTLGKARRDGTVGLVDGRCTSTAAGARSSRHRKLPARLDSIRAGSFPARATAPAASCLVTAAASGARSGSPDAYSSHPSD